jgi:hypothetical protein
MMISRLSVPGVDPLERVVDQRKVRRLEMLTAGGPVRGDVDAERAGAVLPNLCAEG